MRKSPGASSQAIYLVLATGSSQALVAFSYILAARGSEPAAFGAVASAIAIGMALIGIVDFGANSLWVRSIASKELSIQEVTRRSVWKVILAALIAAIVTLAVWMLNLPPEYVSVGFIFFLTTLAQLTQVPLRAAARSDRVALSVVISRVAGFAVLLGLTFCEVPSTTSLWVSLSVNAVVEAIMYVVLTPRRFRYRFDSLRIVNPWKDSMHFGVYSIATSLQSLDVPVVSAAAGPVAAGAYAAVNRWTQPLGLAVGGFTSASAPFVAGASSFAHAWRAVRKATWMLFAALASCVVAFFLAEPLVPLLLGQDYLDAVGVFQVMALGTIPALLNQPLAVFSQMRGGDRAVGVVTAVGISIRLVSAFALSAAFGAVGGAFAFAISQVVLLVGLSVILARMVRSE